MAAVAARSYSDLIAAIPPIEFGPRRAEATPTVLALADDLTARTWLPDDVVEAAREVAAGKPGPSCRARLVKCYHNHVSVFEAGGTQYLHKLYGNPGGWARECLARGFAAEAGIPGVDPPAWAERLTLGGRELFYAVLPLDSDADPTPRDALADASPALVAELGRWTRRLHDSCDVAAEASGRRFSIVASGMFDTRPIWTDDLLGERSRELAERISARLLAQAGDTPDALVHNDLTTPGNAFVRPGAVDDPWQVTDFEFSHIGHRTADLLWIHVDAPQQLDPFLAGYGRDWPDSLRVLLDLWRALVALMDAIGHVFLDRPPCGCGHGPLPPWPSTDATLEAALVDCRTQLARASAVAGVS